MLTVLRDAHGRLDAACEWWLVDMQGRLCAEGPCVFVNQLEVSKGVNAQVVIRNVIADILWRAPEATHGYWERRDSTGAGNTTRHTFTRERLQAYLHKWMEVMV